MIVRPLSLLFMLLACITVFGGCIPEESPIAPYDRGPIREEMFSLGSDYGTQIYFDLDAGQVVQTLPVTAWDLGLRSDPAGYHIMLNTSAIMAAADLGPVKFEDVSSVAGAVWRYDRPDGSWDSTAIDVWWQEEGETAASRGHVYLIDRGYRPDGKRRGYMKLQVLGADEHSYRLRFANLNGSGDNTVTIERDTLRTLTGFSFDDGGHAIDVEPPKDAWDIVLTRYTHIFYDPEYMPYSVTGVLLNRARTVAVLDTVHSFEEITSANVADYTFSEHRDAIGYDWKSYDLDGGKYTVFPYFVYVVRRHDGFTFKLRFVEFYNDQGERGFPRMEWQKL